MAKRRPEQAAAALFGLDVSGEASSFLSGKIQSSLLVEDAQRRYVLQEVNTSVFTDQAAVAQNTQRVLAAMSDANLPRLALLTTASGEVHANLDGRFWRCYRYVDGVASKAITTTDEAQVTARAFGRFDAAVAGLDLIEHINGYHNFDRRVAALEVSIEADTAHRVVAASASIESGFQLIDRLRLSHAYEAWKETPRRNVHNDAKGPNCIIGPDGSRTVIDLDTTMPGTLLADIGELVRSSTRALSNPTAPQVMGQIEAVNRGFLAGYGSELDRSESAAILLAGPLMTCENGVRFLTDHLSGDTYYSVSHEDDNLRRAQAMFELVRQQIAAIESAGMTAA